MKDDRDLVLALAPITIARDAWVPTSPRYSDARQRLVQPASAEAFGFCVEELIEQFVAALMAPGQTITVVE